MDLYLAIGGGQWNKYVAPTLKEMGGVKRNENLSGSSRGGCNWFQRAFWPDQENIKAKESILNMKIHLAGIESRVEELSEQSKVLRPYILISLHGAATKAEKSLAELAERVLTVRWHLKLTA